MPSSLTRVISITLVFSTCPPVSVLVRARATSLEDFLGGMASGTRRLIASWRRTSGYAASDLPEAAPTCLPQDDHRLGFHSLPRPPIGQMIPTWYRNINLLSIDYAFRPRLRIRLTLGGFTWPRNPCIYGGRDSRSPYRYSFQHQLLWDLQRSSRYAFISTHNALLPLKKFIASVRHLSPVTFSAQNH